jgi:Holliday junction resolvase RusA-like endonuclease
MLAEPKTSSGLTFTIPGVPFAQPDKKQTRQGRRFLPPRARTWRKYAQDYMIEAAFAAGLPTPAFAAGVPIHLTLIARWPMPISRHLKRSLRPGEWRTQRPDMKNVLTALEDAGNGLLWADDSQIVAFELYKVTREQSAPAETVVYASSLEGVTLATFFNYEQLIEIL